MKLWLKANPEVTAETLKDTELNGYVPVLAHSPQHTPPVFYAVVILDEWSSEQIVPAPESVPETGFLVVYGHDPAYVEYLFFAKEKDAAVAVAKTEGAFGYVPISISRNAMIER